MRIIIGFALVMAIGLFGFTSSFSPLKSKAPKAENAELLACSLTVDAGEDITICVPGKSFSLNALISDDFISVSWEPASVFTDPGSANTSASLDETTTLIVSVRSFSDVNLIVNGNFSLNDSTTFDSDYIYGTGGGVGLLSNEGEYALAANPADTHNQFADCSDHTGGGNMMVVNASGEPNNVWCQTITTAPNTEYIFSAWVASVVSQNPAELQFSINGTLLGNVFNAPSATCLWSQFFEFWNSGNTTTAEICIANVNFDPAGNDFALDDITFREVCEASDDIIVTVANLNASWTSPGSLCQNEAAITLDDLLDPEATTGGTWTINGNSITTLNPAILLPGGYNIQYTVELNNCTEQNTQQIDIDPAPMAGTALEAADICSGTDTLFVLSELLNGEDAGGTWTETSSVPSLEGAFDAVNGLFNTASQIAGTYTFEYLIAAVGSCPDAATTVRVIINSTPEADAGEDMSLDCDMAVLTIGGPNTSTGVGISHQWTASNGSPPSLPDIPFTEVDQPDTYILTVTNIENGCSSNDAVIISSDIASFDATVSIIPISCAQANDGLIIVDSVNGGIGPYTYSLNGGAFSSKNEFSSLSAGTFLVSVKDNNGCETTVEVVLEQAPELGVVLNTDLQTNPPTLVLGDSTRLSVLVNVPFSEIDSIVWDPVLPACDGCSSAFVKPFVTTTYSVRVIDSRACSETAILTIFVEKIYKVYVPNAFSPNDDGINDIFLINSGNEVQNIKNFLIMDRWGNMVFRVKDSQPNDPAFGWDGQFKGQKLNPAVFTYMAELEMADGEVIIVKGEVNLLN